MRQVWNLEDQLKRVVIIKPDKSKLGTVQLGSTVTLETTDGTKKKFEILGTLETDPAHGRISHTSPLGAALMGKKEGETVIIKIGAGTKEYKLLNID